MLSSMIYSASLVSLRLIYLPKTTGKPWSKIKEQTETFTQGVALSTDHKGISRPRRTPENPWDEPGRRSQAWNELLPLRESDWDHDERDEVKLFPRCHLLSIKPQLESSQGRFKVMMTIIWKTGSCLILNWTYFIVWLASHKTFDREKWQSLLLTRDVSAHKHSQQQN